MCVRRYTLAVKEARPLPGGMNTSSYGSTAPNATAALESTYSTELGQLHEPACDHDGSRCTSTLANDSSATLDASGQCSESATMPALANVLATSWALHSPTPELLSGAPHTKLPPA